MSVVALTNRQSAFFSYFKEYHQTNGFFPTVSQAFRDLQARGIKCNHATIQVMIGNLFLKGAFTGGKTMSWGNIRRNAVVSVSPIDVNKPTTQQPAVQVAPRVAARTQAVAPAPANNSLDSLDVEKLRKLLSLF